MRQGHASARSYGSFDSGEEAERKHSLKALEKTKWVVGGLSDAAKLLGLNRTTLLARMKKLGIEKINT